MLRSLLKTNVKYSYRQFSNCVSGEVDVDVSKTSIPDYICSKNSETLSIALKSMVVRDNFISEEEEGSLLAELEPYLKRMRYELSHWDDAIHGYRETEKAEWNERNKEILQRVREVAFDSTPSSGTMKYVHVLDLTKEGYIKPHVDSTRFCGDTIAGLSLVSPSIMRLVPDKKNAETDDLMNQSVDVLLRRRSLYIMRGPMRYEFTHEILQDAVSYFKEKRIERGRRISVICRNEPIFKKN